MVVYYDERNIRRPKFRRFCLPENECWSGPDSFFGRNRWIFRRSFDCFLDARFHCGKLPKREAHEIRGTAFISPVPAVWVDEVDGSPPNPDDGPRGERSRDDDAARADASRRPGERTHRGGHAHRLPPGPHRTPDSSHALRHAAAGRPLQSRQKTFSQAP